MAWALVIFGGIVECFWVSGLKYADTLILYALTMLGIIISFVSMIVATKRLEVSVCYAVFVGIGAAGVVVSEIVIFGEDFSLIKVSLIFTLLLGVIGLKLTSSHNNDDNLSDRESFSPTRDSHIIESPLTECKKSNAINQIIESDSTGGVR
ncbi:QacE family quaternary ammonium compound efflux SMR transporter [Helicobacter didelphidarum]|uniref:QacE family quaternary ammonium compound efflux SMR transporter n=2 Tax=Helicobacter didelphidarum TaxID=2040648 RepID=A0A3D8IMI7_9HELI|nr:QacE family quaternary ammonium compound efflux SMR transporter [Helicobacter didelphidarum]